jgi:hypothetical protein
VSATLQPSLAGRFPVVFPSRRAVTGGDPPDVALPDRLSIVAMRADGWDVPLAVSMSSPSSPVLFEADPPCPGADDRCGFRPGDLAILGDRLGAFDLVEVIGVAAGTVALAPAVLTRPYAVDQDARLGRLRLRQLFFDAARRQIRTGDGLQADLPLLDAVAAFSCTYFGVAVPPAEPRPPLGTASCLYNADGSARLATLPAGAGHWVELPLASFRDGPFCGSGDMQYDADLLRVRRVVVRVRLTDARVSHGVGEGSALRHLNGDREVVIDVALRSLDPR